MEPKPEKRLHARTLRLTGLSVNAIAKQIGVSQGSVSYWVQDVPLTENQRLVLTSHAEEARKSGVAKAAVWHRRDKESRWAHYHQEADLEWPARSKDPAFMFGLALYAGEGGKTIPNTTSFSNANPDMICKELGFFRQIGIPQSCIRAMLHIQDKGLQDGAENFWIQRTGLPPDQFYRTVVAISRASLQRGRILPHGTLRISANNTRIRQKIERWLSLALTQS